MKKGVRIKQHDDTDCGAACLASISAHYNLRIPISKIRQYCNTDKMGTNVLGLVEAANLLNFEAKGVRGDISTFKQVPKPFIAHIVTEANLQHYVVVYETGKKFLKLMDPSTGKMYSYKYEDFNEQWSNVMVLLLPNKDFTVGNNIISNYTRIWYLVKPHKAIFIQAFVGALVYTLLGFSTAIYIQKITDHILIDGNLNLLNFLSVIMIVLLLFQIAIGVYKDIFLVKTGQLIDARLILGYYKYLLKLPQRFFDTMRIGEIISRINDAAKIRAFINETSLNLMVNSLIVIFSFTIMFFYYWKLALILMTIIPFYIGIYWTMNYLNKKTERKIMESSANLETQLVESLNSISTIKRFGIESYINTKTENVFILLLKKTYKSAQNSIFSGNSSNFISHLFTIILLWAGSYYVIEGKLSPGELMSFYAILGYFTKPIYSLIDSNKQIQNAKISADRLFEIMDLDIESNKGDITLKKEDVGDIEFKNVNFSYGTRVDVFKGLNLTIREGKVTSIVGKSGSGKTTLISLLQNIYGIKSGRIAINHINIKNIENSSLRSIIGVVPQEINLFKGTIMENIALGDYKPDDKKVIEVCRVLGVLEFIEELPDGFHTDLGENGGGLSGGQKQQIAIARALYKDPEILILDEATSSLDSLSEGHIQRTINTLKAEQKTVIIIAHRLRTVVGSDEIIVMDKGEVIEKGTHDELYHRQGQYYKFWKEQVI